MDSIRVTNSWCHVDARLVIPILFVTIGIAYTIPYLSDRYGLRRFPGPLLAKVSNLWFASQIAHRRNIAAVHAMHEEYGSFY